MLVLETLVRQSLYDEYASDRPGRCGGSESETGAVDIDNLPAGPSTALSYYITSNFEDNSLFTTHWHADQPLGLLF
nr:unnamed protein product [Spirometra erinaceieuropaei]